ncbi:tyrosine-type recombinase/integrase [Sporolactobacillus sp. CQH2019]|uniref:tyrosine-type recombinase/integrase n=1 Tax=Sporolactobacillus sp. CQH2019 TaxID=3023512 RepID=UPI002367779D|nr:tyrosine-type recombinase/integrase [Sporolactobacillus sp. CQH2019]MDD9149224.1 tyrosine-type recombinase/integrase [Sporolactobacillus sp. CQH2019]
MIGVSLTTRERNGKWQYRVRYMDPNTGNWKEKSQGGYSKERDARAEGRMVARKVEDGAYKNDRITVGAFLDFWYETYKEDKLAYNTLMNIKRSIKVIKPELGNLMLDKLNSITYQKFINRLSKRYAISSVRTFHRRYHDAFKIAVKTGYLQTNPAADVVITNRKIDKEKKKILEYDEIPKFMIAARSEYDRLTQSIFVLQKVISEQRKQLLELNGERNAKLAVEINKNVVHLSRLTDLQEKAMKSFTALFFDLNTGLRCGELIALTWDDYHDQSIEVNKTAVHITHVGTVITEPKTKSSHRMVELDSETNKILLAWKHKQHEFNMANGIRNTRNLIFTGQDGQSFLSHLTVRFWIRKACEKAGIDHISTHALRHTHTVMEMDSGADSKYVSERLGHSKVDTTMNIYHHVSHHVAEASAERYENFMGQLWGRSEDKAQNH